MKFTKTEIREMKLALENRIDKLESALEKEELTEIAIKVINEKLDIVECIYHKLKEL